MELSDVFQELSLQKKRLVSQKIREMTHYSKQLSVQDTLRLLKGEINHPRLFQKNKKSLKEYMENDLLGKKKLSQILQKQTGVTSYVSSFLTPVQKGNVAETSTKAFRNIQQSDADVETLKINPKHLDAFAKKLPQFVNLKHLELWLFVLQEKSVLSLLAISLSSLPKLESLQIVMDDQHFSDDFCNKLRCLRLKSFHLQCFSSSRMTNASIESLVKQLPSMFPRIQELRLECSENGRHHFKTYGNMPELRRLDLSGFASVSVDDFFVPQLKQYLINSHIHTWNHKIRYTRLSDIHGRWSQMTDLHVRFTDCSFVRPLLGTLGGGFIPKLETLTISHCCGDDVLKNMIILAESLSRVPQLKVLNWSHNEIDNDGAIALAKSLVHVPHLQSLQLSGNKIGDDGAQAFMIAFILGYMPALKYMGIVENQMSNDYKVEFKTMLEAPSMCKKVLPHFKKVFLEHNIKPGQSVKAKFERDKLFSQQMNAIENEGLHVHI